MSPAALLLAGGRATRLGPLRARWAKACVPVAGRSPLAHLLPRVQAAGFTEAWINLHYQPEQVRAEALAHAPAGLQLRFLEEPELLGTGGTLRAVAARCGRLPELVVNAKLYTDFPLARLRATDGPAVVLHPSSPLATFGGLLHDDAGWLRGLQRRAEPLPPGAQAAVYTGICRPGPEWLTALEEAHRTQAPPWCLIRHGLLPALAAGAACKVLLHTGYWCEISTPERIREAATLLGGDPSEALIATEPPDPAGSGSDLGAR